MHILILGAEIEIHISHRLPRADALSQMKKLMANVGQIRTREVYDAEAEWEHYHAHFELMFHGTPIHGVMRVGTAGVRIHAKVPFWKALFWGKRLEKILHDEAQQLLRAPQEKPATALTRDLKFGDKGEQVTILQKLLIAKDSGPMAKRLAGLKKLDPTFGRFTQAAVAEFQKASALAATGSVDAATREAICR